jgi:hypothetical protein
MLNLLLPAGEELWVIESDDKGIRLRVPDAADLVAAEA